MNIEEAPANVGLSYLFPAVPILCFASFFCCMLLLPGIIKTRIFALIFYVLWLGFGSSLIGFNMCVWRNRTFDAPIYGDIVARIIHVYPITLYLSIFCFGKFTWNITRPESSLKVVDERRRYNYVDAFLCIGISLLWTPFLIVTTRGRYRIIEDLGPVPNDRASMDSVLIKTLPLGVIATASTYYSILTIFNILRARRSALTIDTAGLGVVELGAAELGPYRALSNRQTLRYLALVIIHLIAMPFGFLWPLLPLIIHRNDLMFDANRPWYKVFDIQDNIRQLPLVRTLHRDELHLPSFVNFIGFLFAIPISGILFFLLFGLGSDIFGVYRVWLDPLKSKMKIFGARDSPSHITPFQLDNIALASYPLPVQTTTKGDFPRNHSVPPPTPTNVQFPSPSPPLHGHSIMDRLSLISPLERARTFRKEPIPTTLLPFNGPSSSSNASLSRHSPRDVSSCRSSPRDLKLSYNRPTGDRPPPYEPAGEVTTASSSRNKRTL